jgi:purine-cytosine permease-like protein
LWPKTDWFPKQKSYDSDMPLPKDQAWFPAKRYGYGWGIPSRWQGWAVMLSWLVALIVGGTVLTARHPDWFVVFAFAIGGVLVAICYWKGESPSWRWGDKE